jgi:glycosyltransferase involved in cell wall biosynthesis
MSSESQIRTLHVLSGLGIGGAQAMLYKLLSCQDRDRFQPAVLALVDRGGGLREKLEGDSVPLMIVRQAGRTIPLSGLAKSVAFVRRFRPHLVQGWMYHGNLAASFLRRLAGRRVPVLWNIRHSLHDLGAEKRSTRTVIRMGKLLSRGPVRIVYNSHLSRQQHGRYGYCADRATVIPNGFDCDAFCPDPEARRAVRRELGLREEALLIGLVARYHPMKDQAGFLRAAADLARQHADVHFVLAGPGVDEEDGELVSLRSELGLDDRVHLLGPRSDVTRLNAALDIAGNSSAYGEAFSQAIGEAMACGVPCVVTDVGDSARIVDTTGRTVPPRDPAAMAAAWHELLQMDVAERQELGRAARQRVLDQYALPAIVDTYESLYEEIAADFGSRRDS